MNESGSTEPHRYEIKVCGHVSGSRTGAFEGMELTLMPEGCTLITGPAMDQSALFGLLIRIRDFGLPLVSVVRQETPKLNGDRDVNREKRNGKVNDKRSANGRFNERLDQI